MGTRGGESLLVVMRSSDEEHLKRECQVCRGKRGEVRVRGQHDRGGRRGTWWRCSHYSIMDRGLGTSFPQIPSGTFLLTDLRYDDISELVMSVQCQANTSVGGA